MPLWKKMAEAFGRAMEQPGGSEKLKKVIDEIGGGPGSSFEMEFKTGRDIGKETAGKADRLANKYGNGMENPEARFADAINDDITDKRVLQDFEDAFKDVSEEGGYRKWRKEAGNRPLDDGMNGEIENMEREGAVMDIRESMIKDLTSGMDVSDVIKKYSR